MRGGVVEAGQVWRNRHECLLCSIGPNRKRHHHHVLVLEVLDATAVVVDVDGVSGRRRGEPYPLPLDRFGSLEAGGLGLVAVVPDGGVRPVPVDEPDVEARSVLRIEGRGVKPYRIAGARRAVNDDRKAA